MNDCFRWFHHDGNRLQIWLGPPVVTGKHALTPASVRSRYQLEVRNASLVIWLDQALGLFGLKSGQDEITWALEDLRHLVVEFCRPAKGGGHLALFVGTRSSATECFALHSPGYSEERLAWFRLLSTRLETWFPGMIFERDLGYDA